MILSNHIKDLITAATEMRKAVGVDKKALNKTIARLEEAEIWSERIIIPGSLADTVSSEEFGQVTMTTAGTCTCRPGAIDIHCPIHARPA